MNQLPELETYDPRSFFRPIKLLDELAPFDQGEWRPRRKRRFTGRKSNEWQRQGFHSYILITVRPRRVDGVAANRCIRNVNTRILYALVGGSKRISPFRPLAAMPISRTFNNHSLLSCLFILPYRHLRLIDITPPSPIPPVAAAYRSSNPAARSNAKSIPSPEEIRPSLSWSFPAVRTCLTAGTIPNGQHHRPRQH